MAKITKSELKGLIREVLKEELNKTALQEGAVGFDSYYAIKAWDASWQKKSGMPSFDSEKKGIKYKNFDEVLAALKSDDLSYLGAYEITNVKVED